MKKYKAQKSVQRLALVLILVNVALGITTNIATSVLPDVFRSYLWLSWPVLVFLLVIYLYLSFIDNRAVSKSVKNRRNLHCPFCLTPLSLHERRCPNCEAEISDNYRKEHQEIESIFVATLSWAGHGRSSLYTAMFNSAIQLAKVWPQFFIRPDDHSGLSINSLNEFPTSIRQGTTYSVKLFGMPCWQNLSLHFQDFPGDIFDESSLEHYQYLLNADIIVLIATIDRNVNDLLAQYIRLMNRDGRDPNEKPVILAITKSDLISNLSEPLADYRATSSMSELADIHFYLARMDGISKKIEKWLLTFQSGRSLVRLAEHSGLNIRYSLTSVVQSSRIFDPLLWILILSQECSSSKSGNQVRNED